MHSRKTNTLALAAAVLTCLAHSRLASAALADSAVDNCKAKGASECLAKKGCHWFSYTGYCQLCDKWFGEEQGDFLGCKNIDPKDYCQSIFSNAQQKSGGGVNVEDVSFKDAITHYQVVERSGGVDDPHHRISMCTVWCDSSTLPHKCSGQLQVQDALRGVNYGGRFIPEHFLGLPGFFDLFKGISKPNSSGSLSLCDVNTADAGIRMERFLAKNIKEEHFFTMAKLGFNIVRLPLGYWNLIDRSTSPDGPRDVVRRWLDLQKIMPAQQYRRWIDKIFQFAKAAKMMVMMDLHGAAGGQSGNQNTGCDFGSDFNLYFGTENNIQLGLEAIDVMAKICAAKGEVCYGIELLSQPDGPVGQTVPDPKAITVRRLESDGLRRHVLANFYDRAIHTARRHLNRTTPIVLMDWPSWLGTFWMQKAKFSYKKHGRVVFSTHLYNYAMKPIRDQETARRSLLDDMKIIQEFYSRTGYETMISEYSLSNHGSGSIFDSFDYNSFTNWFVHQCNQMGLGSMVWNFDSYWSAPWGPVYKPKIGMTLVEWKNIWSSTPEPLPDLYCASCSPPVPTNALSCSALKEDCSTTHCCNNPGKQCYIKNAYWAGCKDVCQPGSIDYSEMLKWQTPWSCEKLGTRALPKAAEINLNEETEGDGQENLGPEKPAEAKATSFWQHTMSMAPFIFVAISVIVFVVLISPHLRRSNYEAVSGTETLGSERSLLCLAGAE